MKRRELLRHLAKERGVGNVTSTVISKIWIVSSIVCQRLGVQCTREPAIPRLESALEIRAVNRELRLGNYERFDR